MKEAIEAGAQTRDAVTKTCLAGGDCGACHGMIESMIEDHLEPADRPCAELRERFGDRTCPPATASAERLVPETALVRKSAA